MKNLFIIVILFAFATGFLSFTEPNYAKRAKEKSKTELNSINDWGEWIKTSCYKYLYFRVKRGDYNSYSSEYYWYIQFRNDYSYKIDLDYDACGPSETTTKLTHSHRINANDTYTSPYFLIDATDYINVSVAIYIDYEKKPCDR